MGAFSSNKKVCPICGGRDVFVMMGNGRGAKMIVLWSSMNDFSLEYCNTKIPDDKLSSLLDLYALAAAFRWLMQEVWDFIDEMKYQLITTLVSHFFFYRCNVFDLEETWKMKMGVMLWHRVLTNCPSRWLTEYAIGRQISADLI